MNTKATDHSFQEESSLSRVEYAYRKIKTHIATNVYPAGYQVLEPELASQLGVSRTPVREALIRLEADNLIQLIPRRGMRVIPLNADDIEEIHQLITTIELSAINWLCNRESTISFAETEATLLSLQEAVLSGDRKSWLQADDDFHIAIIALVENRRMLRIARNLYDQIRRARFLTLDFIDDVGPLVSSRRLLMTEIENKSAANSIRIHEQYRKNLSGIYRDAQIKYQLAEL